MNQGMQNHKYLLNRKAYICAMSELVVILDVVSGKYFAMTQDSASSIGELIEGWPIRGAMRRELSALQPLLDRNLITSDRTAGKPAIAVCADPATDWLVEVYPRGCPVIRSAHLRRFVSSLACSATLKRFATLETIIERVTFRRAQNQTQDIDLSDLRELVRVFDWLRPFAFKKQNECFLLCLTLFEFLSRYSVHPKWVFGVRERPFEAHCWLQYQNQVLTDTPFNVGRMTPILVV